MMEALGGTCQPSFKAKLRPAAGLCQHGASPDDEQRAHVLVTAFAEPAKYRSVACGELFRHQPEPGSEVAPLGEGRAIPDCGHHCASRQSAWSHIIMPISLHHWKTRV